MSKHFICVRFFCSFLVCCYAFLEYAILELTNQTYTFCFFRYQLFYKLPCPQPQLSLTSTVLCTETSYKLLVDTTEMIHFFDSSSTLLDPYPYTSYQFLLQATNIAGAVNSSDSDIITTDESGKKK